MADLRCLDPVDCAVVFEFVLPLCQQHAPSSVVVPSPFERHSQPQFGAMPTVGTKLVIFGRQHLGLFIH
jgi:hypothetical protein